MEFCEDSVVDDGVDAAVAVMADGQVDSAYRQRGSCCLRTALCPEGLRVAAFAEDGCVVDELDSGWLT